MDVPLADARGLSPGQEAVITSDFLPNVEFRGVVSRIVGSANLQRNTLQAKVRVLDPDPRLRPEMLCRVKFMEGPAGQQPAVAAGAPSSDTTRAVMVPESALVSSTGDAATLWVISADGDTAARREVAVGSVKREGCIAITSGLLPGELVILPPHDRLAQGRRVRVHATANDEPQS